MPSTCKRTSITEACATNVNVNVMLTGQHIATEWSRKIAQSLMQRHIATVCSGIMQFPPTCVEQITVYLSLQNLYQLFKYSLINSRNWIHVMSDVTLHVNMTPLTVENRLLIKDLKRLDC